MADVESLELKIKGNASGATKSLNALITTLEKLEKATAGGCGLDSVAKALGNVSKAGDRVASSNNRSAKSFASLGVQVTAAYLALKKGAKVIASWINESNSYVENMNLFNVAMGQYAESAMEYANKVSDAMGIDTSEWIRSQGVFMTLATGFGVAGNRASEMSEKLTQLGYDLSSFYNISVEEAMTKLKSGLAGELEPLRSLGYDLSQAKLEAIAFSLGIDKSVSSMTQAEKAELRYYAIMTQVTQVHGDMARTLEDPANQLRIFRAQLNMAARSLGNVFIPALNAILPYAIAAVKVIRCLADAVASLFGFVLPEVDDSPMSGLGDSADNASDSIDDTNDSAKKLRKTLLGIDELNVLSDVNKDDESSGTGFTFDLPEYSAKFINEAVTSRVDEIVEKMKEWLGIAGDIKNWGDLLHTKLAAILMIVGAIGGAFAAWKITSGVTKFITTLPSILKTGLMGIVVGGAVVGAAWLLDNVETTTEQILAIISAAALAVGAILAFTGTDIPLGLGLMAVGAVSMGSAIAMNTDALSEDVKEVIAIITAAVSEAFLVVGAILAFTGVNIPLGLGLMAGGALAMGSAIAPNWNSLDDDVRTVISNISGIVGVATLAVGAILLFTGAGAPLGLGLMAVGATSMGTAIAANWESLTGDIENVINTIAIVVGGASLAIGAVLAFTGANIPLGIGLMAVGAVSMGSTIAMNTSALSDEVKGVIAIITAAVSMALLAVGTILAFTGANIPLGIGLMAAGALTMGSSVLPNWNSLSDETKKVISIITAAVGGALLAVGAILAFTGAGTALGIGLMVAGAASLGTSARLNWNTIVESMRGTVGKIAAIAGGASMVIGLLLLLTGVGVPLGLGLLLGGAASLGSAIAFNWDSIVEAVKGVWDKITAFWDEHIAPIFTVEWWKNLGKNVVNGLIAGIEGGINFIITGFENMVNWVIGGLNKISFSLPDWLGGGTFGINIKPVSFERVSIPRLAEGGMVNEGQMFIAREAGPELVGSIGNRTAVANNDQIVAAVSKGVYQAVVQAMGQAGNQTVEAKVNDKVLFEVVVNRNRQETMRKGYNPMLGGA